MEEVHMVVFEDNQLELIDAGLVFSNQEEAQGVCDSYTNAHYSQPDDRKPMVRRMKVR